jgi:hypothetical protein
MSRGTYSQGKRAREADKARKQKEKADRRLQKRDRAPGEPEMVSAEELHGPLPSISEAMEAMEHRATAPREATAIPCRLFVGGLSWNTEAAQLRQAFAEFGPVADVAIVTERDTGKSRGFGFVTMANRKDASKAIEALSNSEMDGRRIVVNVATER